MRWYEATLYGLEQTGTDATRNPICELAPKEGAVLVRTAPMAPRRDDEEGNRFDVLERTFLTKCAPSLLEDAAAVEVRGVLYDIVEVSSWNEQGGAVAIRARKAKP